MCGADHASILHPTTDNASDLREFSERELTYAAGPVQQILRAADEGHALAADVLLRVAVTRLLRLNGRVQRLPRAAPVAVAGPPARIGFTVTGITLYVLWNLTTLLGAPGARAVGDTDAWGLDGTGPAVLPALLAPMLRTTTERALAAVTVLLGLGLGPGLGLLPVLSAGVPVPSAALAALVALYIGGRRRGGAHVGAPEEGRYDVKARRRTVERLDRDRRDRPRLLHVKLAGLFVPAGVL